MHGSFNFPNLQALELERQWQIIRSQSSRIGVKEAAYILDVSEAELVATQCGDGATRLSPAWEELLTKAAACGRLRAQTQNEFADLETVGEFEPLSSENAQWRDLGGCVDLHFYLDRWSSGFAIESLREDGTYEFSFQFFGADGSPVQKFFLSGENGRGAFRSIVEQLKHEDQSPVQFVKPISQGGDRLTWNKTDHFAFIDAWNGMKTRLEFPRLLDDFKITRSQALRLAEGEMTDRLGRFEFENLLKAVAETRRPLTIQIVNAGAAQYFSGNIDLFMINGSLSDSDGKPFAIRINRKGIADAWRVRMPTANGEVASLELYDNQGRPIAAFFDDLSQGEKDSSIWLKIIKNLRNENLEYGLSQLGREVSQPFTIPPGIFP